MALQAQPRQHWRRLWKWSLPAWAQSTASGFPRLPGPGPHL